MECQGRFFDRGSFVVAFQGGFSHSFRKVSVRKKNVFFFQGHYPRTPGSNPLKIVSV